MLRRVLVLAFAVVACAWFALGVRQAHDINQATAIVSQSAVSSAQAKRVSTLLDDAAVLNPDLETDILRGELLTAEHHYAHARQILAHVIHREPKDLDAWVAYTQAAVNYPFAYNAALGGIRKLVRLFPQH